jgi:hypothetical protein
MNIESANRFSHRTSSAAKRQGAAVVELAIVLPVFLVLLFGTIETCTMIFLQQSLKIAAYESTRTAIVPGSSTAEIEGAAQRILASRNIKGASVSITPSNHGDVPYGTFLRIEVTAPCSLNSLSPIQFYGSQNLTGVVEMMKEF